MLSRVHDYLRFTLHATDGDIGRLHDVYFDDQSWTVRYLVVETRHWLRGRRVLLAPLRVRGVDWNHREMIVGLSREQIRESPGVETDRPVAEQNAVLFRECYTLPYYWAVGGYLWRAPATGGGRPPRREDRARAGDPHLRSARQLEGYVVRAVDGDAGHLEDFLLDDASWHLRYAVVNTRLWRPARRVLVPSDWIAWVSWIELAIHVDLRLAAIAKAPDADLSHPLTREDEVRLDAVYGRPPRRRLARMA